MADDAERIARRFHAVRTMIAPSMGTFDDLVPRERELLCQTFAELLRAEVIFPGPSLYSVPDDPAV